MESFNVGNMHYRQEMIRCGKLLCKRCPHGPYWYAYDYLRIFMKKRYVGKKLPPAVEAERARSAR